MSQESRDLESAAALDGRLWDATRNGTEAIAYRSYSGFIEDTVHRPPSGPDAFRVLKAATDAFLRHAVATSQDTGRVMIELIWSYWHEEGMLVQTLEAILRRFQNRRPGPGDNALTRFDPGALRPLDSLLQGWVRNKPSRLTVRRRAHEYDHEYGLRLSGIAAPDSKRVGRRSSFVDRLHSLLRASEVFLEADDGTTAIADAFPELNALRELHLLLAEGAHNEFGDLPTLARAEMLIIQWILARPEMGEFLGVGHTVTDDEPWLDRVDAVSRMSGGKRTSTAWFRDLGVSSERIVLSARYGNWATLDNAQPAANWARYWRPEIQRYVHAFRETAGVDVAPTTGA